MNMIDIREQKERNDFAIEAAEYLSSHKEKTSYTSGDIAAGELFALRFGLGDDCVVIFRIAEDESVDNYQHLIE